MLITEEQRFLLPSLTASMPHSMPSGKSTNPLVSPPQHGMHLAPPHPASSSHQPHHHGVGWNGNSHRSDKHTRVNGRWGKVRRAGLNPSNGDAFIIVGHNWQLRRIFHWEHGGYVMCYKCLLSAKTFWAPKRNLTRVIREISRSIDFHPATDIRIGKKEGVV